MERTDGVYDFSLVMGALESARRYGLKIVYLWFGTWKNSMSCYAPGWVKRDLQRFPRVETLGGETQEMVLHGAENL